MRLRLRLALLSSAFTVVLAPGCADDVPIVPGDGSSSSGSSGSEPTTGDLDSTVGSSSSGPGSSDTGSSGEDPDSTGMVAGCGDGVISGDEACDDANTEDDDGCSATCTVEDGWQCDDQPSSCVAVCGDAVLAGDEQCDDDNGIDGDGCSAACQLEDGWACEDVPSECTTVCGDGFVVGESCDDGNVVDDDGCTSGCLLEVGFTCAGEPSVCEATCGDGLVLGDEQCDDDDLVPDDGCDDACMVELGWSCMGQPSACMAGCGDGLVVGSEQCDDFDVEDGDGCSAACQTEPGWICNNEPSTCATDCGDGILAGDEQCDDDELIAGDGCSAACQIEAGWVCAGEPSACVSDCGDGVMVGPEACDDGNIEQGDGCDFTCEVGFGWSCLGSPSVCTVTAELETVALSGGGGCVLTTLGDVGCFGSNIQSEVGNGTDGVETYLPAFALDAAVAITGGLSFHCAIRTGGDVWCWGNNTDSQMGPTVPAGVDQALPIEIPGAPAAVAISAGDDHVCTIDGVGQVRCWGDNADRQLGQGGVSTVDIAAPSPVALPGGLAAIDLGLGQNHSCAVLEDNTVACWGDDDNGQLGDGVVNPDNSVATLVPGLVAINDVEGGDDTTCALDDLGQVRCWGLSADGEVGVGTLLDQPTPQLVGLPSAAEAIALGEQFTCALLLTDDVYCWGEGTDFQLGNGDLVPVSTPSQVLEVPAVDLVDIEAGARGACVISATNERWCWGFSEEGQLGIAPIYQLEPAMPSFSGPLVELELDRPEYRGVMCGVLLDGTVECAGDGTLVASGTAGAAGYFEPVTRHLRLPTPLSLVSDVQDLAMGDGFICVATTTNVQCWGDNASRQLGQGGVSTTDIVTPVPVMGLGAVDELELGAQFACVRTGGMVQCWGENSSLQTGEGSGTDQSVPFTVPGLVDAVDLTLGEGHACALRASGAVYCWGEDGVGQLGDDDGNPADSAIPVQVGDLPPVLTQVVAGQDHTCALGDGEVYCWGEGGYGNIGQGNENDTDAALPVLGIAGIVQIASGNNFICAVDGVGDMWCWGYSLDGHLGNGGELVTGLGEELLPTPFLVGSGILDVEAGNSMTCIETVAGWSCLGFRSAGQLGNGTTVEPAVPTPMYFGL
jgi:cysteine-rich repeat protein